MSNEYRTVRPPMHPTGFARWLWRLVLDIIDEYREDGVGDLAAAITFWTLLSIPAAVLALISAVSSVEPLVGTNVSAELQDQIQGFVARTFADSEALNEAVSELFGDGHAGVITVAVAVAIFSLSRGFAGMIRAFDKAYDITDGRPWWQVRIVAIGLGLGTIVVVAGAATLFATLSRLPGGTTIQLLAIPATLLLLVVWAATMFHLGPHHRTPWRFDLPGAVLTALGWIVATQGFAFYIRITDSANEVQSLVGAVLLGLTLMHVLSIIMLVGAELNDVLADRAGVVQQPVSWKERSRQIKRRVGSRRDSDRADADTTGGTDGEASH